MTSETTTIISSHTVREASTDLKLMPLIKKVTGWEDDETKVLSLHGRVDSYTAPDLEMVLADIQGNEDNGMYKIILDMEDVSFVSSKGWWVLIQAQKKSKRYNRGEVVFVEPSERFVEAIKLVGMRDYFRIFTTNPRVLALLEE